MGHKQSSSIHQGHTGSHGAHSNTERTHNEAETFILKASVRSACWEVVHIDVGEVVVMVPCVLVHVLHDCCSAAVHRA